VIVFCFQVILISSRLRRVSSKEATPVPLLGTWLPNCSSVVVDLAGLSFIVFDSNVTVNRVRGKHCLGLEILFLAFGTVEWNFRLNVLGSELLL